MAQYHDDSCSNLAQSLGQFVRDAVIPYENDDRHLLLQLPVRPMHDRARRDDLAFTLLSLYFGWRPLIECER